MSFPVGPSPVAPSLPLPQELLELLQELSVAVHKRGIYPSGHPMQLGAVDAVLRRLHVALGARAELAIGVARTQLLLEGGATDRDHPLLRELASRMHDHQLGGVQILPGVSRVELDALIDGLSASPLRGGEPLAARATEYRASWPHVRLSPMAFEQLALLEDGDSPESGTSRQTRAMQLWGALANAALSGEGAGDSVIGPEMVAHLLEQRLGLPDMDEHLSRLLQEAMEEGGAKGAEGAAQLREQLSAMVEHLSDQALQQVLDMGGDRARRASFLTNATDVLGARAVLELVRVASEQDGAPISASVLRLLHKLARQASGTRTMARGADVALRRVARRLLHDWTLDDPNPEAYTRVLADLTAEATIGGPDRRRDALEPERLVEISLQVAVITPSTEAALGRLAMRDGVAATVERLHAFPDSAERESLVGRLLNESTMREQLALGRPDLNLLAQAVDRMRTRAIAPLLQALETREDADAPWGVTLLLRLGADVLVPLGEALPQASPRVLRHLLVVFDRLNAWPPGVDPADFARHPDPSVRREAIRFLLKHEDTREQGALLGLRDADTRTFNQSMHAVMRSCSADAARVLMRRHDDETLGGEMRARVARVIASARTPEALDWLCSQVLTTRWLVGSVRLRRPSLEVLAIIASIAQHYRGEPAADAVLRLAMRSRDDSVRRAATARAEAERTG